MYNKENCSNNNFRKPFIEQAVPRSKFLPGGTRPTTEFLSTPQGQDLIRRIAYHIYEGRGRGNSTKGQEFADCDEAILLAKYGLNRQLLRRHNNGLPLTFEVPSKTLA